MPNAKTSNKPAFDTSIVLLSIYTRGLFSELLAEISFSLSNMADDRFGVVDYVVFAAMLLIPAAIGVYYACFGAKQKTTREYLLGDQNMPPFSVALSLTASFLSAITLLGVPAEVYTFGLQYLVLVMFAYIPLTVVVIVLYVPMFHRVKVTCANEVRCYLCPSVACSQVSLPCCPKL